MRRTWEIGTHTFPTVWVLFSIRFLSYGILQRIENAWVFSSNFPQHQKSQQNSSNGKGLGNWFSYFFHKVYFFSIRFPSCGILHHIGNTWVFSSISHSMGKGRKIHQMGKAWENGSRENPGKPAVCGEPGKLVLIIFPEYGCFFPIRFISYGIVYHM